EHRDDGVDAEPRIRFQPAQQARKTGAAAETTDVQLAQLHSRLIVVRYNRPMPDTDSTQFLDRELRGIFGARLRSLVAYGSPAPAAHDAHGHGPQPASRSMAVVESLTEQDLRACAARAAAWHAHGLATPLFVVAGELARSLDAFPLEFDAIAADHRIVSGPSPF